MGFLTSIRTSLVLISFTAISIILWLTVSFWHAAYVHRLDAGQLLNSIETDDLLFETSRGLISQRSLANIILSEVDAADASLLEEFNSASSLHSAQFDSIRSKIDTALNNKSLRNRLTFISSEIERLEQKLFSSFSVLSKHESMVKRQGSVPSLQRKDSMRDETFKHYTSLVDSMQSLREAIYFLPRFNDVDLDNLQALRDTNWQFSRAFAKEVTLMSSVLTSGFSYQLTQSERAEIESLHLETLDAWDRLKQYKNKQGALSELSSTIDDIEERFYKEFVNLRAAIISNNQLLNRNSITLDQWLAIESRTTTLLDRLDKLNSEQIRLVAKRVESTAVRNLIIDSAIVLFCLFIGITVIGVLGKIRHLATHDGLTGLPNRMRFEGLLEHHITDTQQDPIALMFIDLDGFKNINDTHGHEVGDRLLQSVATRLNKCVADKGVISRYGGDEFSITVAGSHDKKYVLEIGEEIVKCLSTVFDIEGFSVQIGSSVGISFFPEDAKTPDELKSNADFAMYYAKSQGRNLVCEFDPDIALEHQNRQQLKTDLKNALEEQQFTLVYQPQVDTNTQSVAGLEALIRWQHPEKGFISPEQFIPLAEESGQIQEIGDWVLDEACRQMACWHKNGLSKMQIAVNVCSMQFVQADFIEFVEKTIQRHNLDPSCLELEITESVLVGSVQQVKDNCHRLHELNVKVAIDDFGTGYSSLSYLQELPVDTLKIDRAFVSGLDDATSKSVAKTIVMLAQSCGLETVAEGAETYEQTEIIRELGCDYIQGYFYSKPVSAEEIPDHVESINKFCSEQSRAA